MIYRYIYIGMYAYIQISRNVGLTIGAITNSCCCHPATSECYGIVHMLQVGLCLTGACCRRPGSKDAKSKLKAVLWGKGAQLCCATPNPCRSLTQLRSVSVAS